MIKYEIKCEHDVYELVNFILKVLFDSKRDGKEAPFYLQVTRCYLYSIFCYACGSLSGKQSMDIMKAVIVLLNISEEKLSKKMTKMKRNNEYQISAFNAYYAFNRVDSKYKAIIIDRAKSIIACWNKNVNICIQFKSELVSQ